jgi:hypothetical protein
LVFTIASIIFHGQKLIPKLTEGVTLIQSVAIIYWIADKGFFSGGVSVLTVAAIAFCLYSVYHAFSHARLSEITRLILSLWSSIVTILFAVDIFLGVSQSTPIENLTEPIEKFYALFTHFLLGISTIYMANSFSMLIGFLPGRGEFCDLDYASDKKRMKQKHISRYSEMQVEFSHSVICVLASGTLFILNYCFEFLPRHSAIWLVFALLPLIIKAFEKIRYRERLNLKGQMNRE